VKIRGPPERGEKSDVALVSSLDECTPTCDGSEHLCDVGVGMFLLRTPELDRRARKSALKTYSMARQTFCVLEGGETTDKPHGIGGDGGRV
jgi:hypothetical protein